MIILLIEDNPHDVELTEDAVEEIAEKLEIEIKLEKAWNGEEGLKWLSQATVLPNLILLDINMPRMNGIEFLSHLKNRNNPHRTIPVVVMTTSTYDEDVLQAYENYCNAYIEKPIQYKAFVEILKKIGDFWLNSIQSPQVEP